MRPCISKGLILFASLLALPSCGESGCRNSVTSRVAAPDGRHQAIIFERDCGATTAASAQVAVVKTNGQLPDSPGNAFISEDNPKVEVSWLSADSLLITYEGAARVSRQQQRVGGVFIQFANFPTPMPAKP